MTLVTTIPSRTESLPHVRRSTRPEKGGAPKPSRRDWIIPSLLILLGIVPAIGGSARLADLGSGSEVTAANARFVAAPIPIVLHIFGAIPFGILGALQFAPGLRKRRHWWHRLAGRVVVVCGMLASVTGVWMTLTYPWANNDGLAVYLFRLAFGSAMGAALVLALVAVRRRDFAAHGDWMTRAYAIGMGAGTQVFTHLPWFILVDGNPPEGPRAVMMGAGWIINAIVAEWIIQRGRSKSSGLKTIPQIEPGAVAVSR